jgi:hypothetical protein
LGPSRPGSPECGLGAGNLGAGGGGGNFSDRVSRSKPDQLGFETYPDIPIPNNADTASEALQATAEAAYVITALATPSGEQSGDWVSAKTKGLSVGIAAVALTEGTTDLLKYTINRTRPDNSGHDSFPSGHASRTAACNTLATRNLQYLEMPDGARTGLRAGFLALSLTTGWARLEAKKHFPSDVLAGMAIGHFLGAFINDAFLGVDSPKNFFFALEPSKKDIYCSMNWVF